LQDDENNDYDEIDDDGDSDSSLNVEWINCVKEELKIEATHDEHEASSVGKQIFTNNDELLKCRKCDECGKCFMYPSQLKSHLLSHSGEKPCVCKTCGKRYINAFKLKIHSRTHT
jgi:uncharacterized Zn-finger protein